MDCPFCKNEHTVEVSEHAYNQWLGGTLIQKAMPNLSSTEREQIISHICPKCQVKLFGEDDFDIEEDEGDDISACYQDSLEFTGQWW